MNAPTRIPRPEPSRDQVVTSSDLVRHFGIWQDRAARSPVYVLQRGRPRFVLTTVDVMEALCATPMPDREQPAETGHSLLDGVSDLVVTVHSTLHITFANHAARAYFGDAVTAAGTAGDLTVDSAGPILAEAVRRVSISGVGETLELPSSTYPGRTLAMAVSPHAGGVAIIARDITLAADLAEARARDDAERQALGIVGNMAKARINLRGYLEQPDASLTALTGLGADALASVRFVSLLDISSRAVIGDAIEAVIADGDPRAKDAMLLVNRGSPLPVRIGFAALRQNGVVRGVVGLIARSGAENARG